MSDTENLKPKLTVGLEIHRQLDTSRKLFCGCPTEFAESEPESKFLRRLRPTQSELGQIDQAAMFEFHRGRSILYESDHQTSCLVEMDEEPPARLNREAVEACLTAALLMGAKPVDEIHVMRKVVIDGSNTTGFQRTAVIALNGALKVDSKTIPITQISLEEDAARKATQVQTAAGYRIDRLGVPLIEVTTGPVLQSPDEVEKVAYAIGTVLRATRKVKRGLGSIRQDLNVSIPEGALIEIKGVQELEILAKAVELEVNRQQTLLGIRNELSSRNLKPNQIERTYVNFSELFLNSEARVIKAAMAKGGVVLAVRLPKFKGLLGRELAPGLRFGTELSNRASFWAGVGGIFHSDELPAYGISAAQVTAIRDRLGLAAEDAFVLVADDNAKAQDALDAVVDRANEALAGVPEETRTAMPDGTTRYMRPRPGAARMYPETDVPETPLPEEQIATLRAHLPETPEKLATRLMDQFSLNQKLAKQVVDSDYLSLFEQVVADRTVPPTFAATFLTETCKSLERDGVAIHTVPDAKIAAMFQLMAKGAFAKEAMPDLLKWQVSNPNLEPSQGIQNLGLQMLSETELEQVIERHIEKNKKLVETKGQGAFPSIMGSIMSEVRGRTDPKLVTEALKKRLARTV
ncbi:MAG TPA: Glu-tRNA(Gln) amidotransferase subunit GatE [Candidatus Acidoferrales bacterium]|nr:Glu-tRNA(Gln) amidotransferase subunit GatE [Candidatus Acidoferrales bacterium]